MINGKEKPQPETTRYLSLKKEVHTLAELTEFADQAKGLEFFGFRCIAVNLDKGTVQLCFK